MIVHARPSVSMDSSAHFPSTWRTFGQGRLLTNRSITTYALLGRYGPDAKRRAEESKAGKRRYNLCLGCGKNRLTLHLHYDYLPSPGQWCALCINALRKERRKSEDLAKRVREAQANARKVCFV